MKSANQLTSFNLSLKTISTTDLFNFYFSKLKHDHKFQLDFYDYEMIRLRNKGMKVDSVLDLKIKFLDELKLETYKKMNEFYR